MDKPRQVNKGKFKGFIGPLGDDIPSIFPIVFGVLIFLGTMTFAFNLYDQKNIYLNSKQAVLDISNAVDNSGYLSDSGFNSLCPSLYRVIAKREGVRAIITVEKFCPVNANCYDSGVKGYGPVDISRDIFNVGIQGQSQPYDPKVGLYCDSSRGVPNQYALDNYGVRSNKLPANYEILNFPVAVDCCKTPGELEGVGMVNVIGWTN